MPVLPKFPTRCFSLSRSSARRLGKARKCLGKAAALRPAKARLLAGGFSLVGASLLLLSVNSLAAGFGTYDPRALAMGGATVAAAESQHAHFYNPALLSFHDEDEDLTQDGRFIMPGVLVLTSEGGKAASDLIDDDLVEQITTRVNNFNNDPSNTEFQQDLANVVQDINEAMLDMRDNPIELQLFTGLSVSEPAEREGGSFYVGLRAIVFGQADITDADLALVQDYEEETRFIASDGAQGQSHPELYDANGLMDPRPSLTSTAQISSLALSEWGIAMAKEFDVFGYPVSFGVTPKIMQAEVYRDDMNFVDDVPSYNDNKRTHLTMNADLGVAAELFEHFRLGLSVKDVLAKELASENGLAVQLEPRVRMGGAYVNRWVTVGLDIDLVENKPYADEAPSQELALGVEFRPWSSLSARAGYKQDFAGEADNLISVGLRYQIWRVEMEAAYAFSADVEGGALQLGWLF